MTQHGRAPRPVSRIPIFSSREEEAAWWDSHDLADYQDEFTTIEVTFAEDLSGEDDARQKRPISRL